MALRRATALALEKGRATMHGVCSRSAAPVVQLASRRGFHSSSASALAPKGTWAALALGTAVGYLGGGYWMDEHPPAHEAALPAASSPVEQPARAGGALPKAPGCIASPSESSGGYASWNRAKAWAGSWRRPAPAISTPLPTDKLACHLAAKTQSTMADAQYTPVVLVACGSFNPPTIGHLRMLELARDAMCSLGADVLGAYLSPVGDAYWKPGLASAQHRVRMCELAAETSDFTMVDGWEAAQPTYTRSLYVLQRMQQQLADVWAGGLPARSNTIVAAGSTVDAGSRNLTPPRATLVCGGDVLHSMADPRAWKQDLLRTLLMEHGVVCIARDGSEILDLLNTPGTLVHELQEHITVVQEPIPSSLSSTLVRQELAQNRSVKYFVADDVIQYVSQNRLYFCPAPAA